MQEPAPAIAPAAPPSFRRRPLTLREARRFIVEHHRHSEPPRGWLFGVALEAHDELYGVGVAGRPVGRRQNDGYTVELTRVCIRTDRTSDAAGNAASRIYGALCRAAAALGYTRAITYTLLDERGTSLRAAGFQRDGITKAEGWGRPSRGPRAADKLRLFDDLKMPEGRKVRWVRYLA